MTSIQTSKANSQRVVLCGLVLACLAVLVFVPAAAQAQQTGTLTGKFVHDGTPPERKEIVPTKDQAAFQNKIWDERVVVGEDGGLANVVIYISSSSVPVPDEMPAGMPAQVKMDNQNGAFVPHVVPFWMGKQQFVAANADTVAHNCNCSALGDRTGSFNNLIEPGGDFKAEFSRVQRSLQPVTCNIHPWMKGYVLPRNNPYFAVTNEKGEFKIENIPPGEWEFQVLHEEVGFLDVNDWQRGRFKLKIEAGENSLGEPIKVPASKFEK